MVRDLPHVIEADVIVLLPDWKRSKGANIELLTARACDKGVWEALPDETGERLEFYVSDALPSLWPITEHIRGLL